MSKHWDTISLSPDDSWFKWPNSDQMAKITKMQEGHQTGSNGRLSLAWRLDILVLACGSRQNRGRCSLHLVPLPGPAQVPKCQTVPHPPFVLFTPCLSSWSCLGLPFIGSLFVVLIFNLYIALKPKYWTSPTWLKSANLALRRQKPGLQWQKS